MDADTTCLYVHISNITYTNVHYTFNITHSDRSLILARSAVQSNITFWHVQNLSKCVLNKFTVLTSTTWLVTSDNLADNKQQNASINPSHDHRWQSIFWNSPRSLFSKIFNGLLFKWTLWMFWPNLKSVASPVPEIIAIGVLGFWVGVATCKPPILGKRRP